MFSNNIVKYIQMINFYENELDDLIKKFNNIK